HLVAVLDGVDQSFLDGELDAEDFVIGERADGLEKLLDLFLYATRFGGIAGDGEVAGRVGLRVALAVHRRRPNSCHWMESPDAAHPCPTGNSRASELSTCPRRNFKLRRVGRVVKAHRVCYLACASGW